MSRYLPYIRWFWTLAILAGAFFLFGHNDILSHLANLPVSAIALALGLFTFQVLLSAWRWHFTARQLGLCISWPEAIREYYLATVINQVLPGGVLGDANRALRHGAVTQERAKAVHGVMIERLSGQVVLVVMAAMAWWMLGMSGREISDLSVRFQADAAIILAGVAIVGLGLGIGFRAKLRGTVGAFRGSLQVALLRPSVLGMQLLSSTLVVSSYILVFVVLARGMDAAMPVEVLVPCILCLLLAMVIPVTVAGWGVREGAAGALWIWAGYPAAEGVALSIAYGALFLVSSLPGLVFALPRSQVALRSISNR